jgi:uncharacterized protein involved in exopolysaccharide biosynthesis
MQTADADSISLRELVLLLWRSKWLIVAITFVTAVLAAVISRTVPNTFKATVVLSPVSSSPAIGRLGGQSSQVGGLASLIGLSFGGDSTKVESLAVLQSESLTERYIHDNNLLPVLFASQWDAANKKWRPAPPALQPTLWKANKEFQKIRVVTEDKKLSLTTLTITWTDPVTAARWANELVRAANDDLRARAIRESEQHIAYLNSQAANTDVAQVRSAIYAVLESEIKNVMLARGPGDYALKVIDPAVPPETRAGPFPLLWALIGAAGGFILSLGVLYARSAWRAGGPTKVRSQ